MESTEKIIGQNTLPKQIVMGTQEYSNRQLLLDQSKQFLLEEGKKKETDEENNKTDETKKFGAMGNHIIEP